jgi:hypothetical protein
VETVIDILSRAKALKQEQPEDALALLAPLLTANMPPTGALLLAADCTRLIDPTPDGHRRAQGFLRRALDLDPTSVEATIELGYALHTAETEISPALTETIDRAIALVDQSDIMLTLLRATVLRDQDNTQGAYELIAPAATRHPDSRLLAQRMTRLKKSLKIP